MSSLLCPPQHSDRSRAAFSLVEMLAAVAIIGVIAFLAIPNLVKMRGDAERNVAIARAESLNMAMASFLQVRGRTQAASEWTAAKTDQNKYLKVAPYLMHSESKLTDFMPNGYTVTFKTIDPLVKVTLKQGSKVVVY